MILQGAKMLNDFHFVKSGPIPNIRDWRKLSTAKLTRAERNMRFVEKYIRVAGSDGKVVRLKLEWFQEAFFYSVFDNPFITRKAIFSVARKNGKSTLISAILLCFLVGPEAKLNAQIVSGAMSRDQASIIFKQASQMVILSPELQPIVKVIPSKKTLIGLPLATEYKALASDGSTAVGLDPQLILCDETGQVIGPDSAFISALITSQGARQDPLVIFLSTQAPTDNDYLSREIDDAINSKDPKIVCHLYAADEACDILDPEQWKKSNPALGIFRSEEDMKNIIQEGSRMPSKENSVKNYYLNMRVSVTSPFVSRNVWEANKAAPAALDGMKVYGGLDLSARTDLTSLVLTARDAEGFLHTHCYAWTPKEGVGDRSKRDRVPYDVWVKQGFLRTTPGHTVDYDFVVKDIGDIVLGLNIEAIAFDRWRIDIFKKACETAGISLPLVEMGQGFKDMSPALDTLEADLLNNRIKHGMHPVLTMCAGNAVVTKDPAGGRKLDKSKATGRIDCMVALAMAEGAEGGFEIEKKPEYQMFFI